jgi:glycine cleavage system H lipoate-binding protein
METRSYTVAGRMPAPCIWMQAGIVKRKECLVNYECAACRFDRALRRTSRENRMLKEAGGTAQGKRGGIVSWKEKLRERPWWKQPCLHAMKQRIAFRACTHDYQCVNCEFDQYFNDQFTVFAVVRQIDVLDIKGIKFPQGYYLHPGHCWVKLEGDSDVRIGLDDFALRVLGPLDRIASPLMGKTLQSSEPALTIGRDGFAAKVLSPVEGVVTDINPRVMEKGSLASADPYADGWVLRAHATHLRHDLRALMLGEEAGRFIDGEVERLHELIEGVAGPLAADGGHLGDNIFGHLPQLGWENLTRSFLRT